MSAGWAFMLGLLIGLCVGPVVTVWWVFPLLRVHVCPLPEDHPVANSGGGEEEEEEES